MVDITHFDFEFRTKDGLNLYAQGWKPNKKPKAVICMVHGHGEHSGRYDHWAARFNKQNIAFCGFDLRGHGKSDGKRGHCPFFPYYINDYNIFQKEVEKLFPNVPIVMYGHSMGGAIVLVALLKNMVNVKAAIVTSPWIKLAMTPPNFKILLAKLVKNIVPSLTQKTELNVNHISHDSVEVEKYKNDILVHDKISVAIFMCIYKSGFWILESAKNLKTPLLIMHGSGDEITSHKASIEFADNVGEFAHLKIWDNLYHEMHHEPEREQIFNYEIEWLKKLDK